MSDNIQNFIQGDALANFLIGTAENEIMYGRAGNDIMFGGEGADEMYGDEGNDTLTGGGGDDSLSGGIGDDNLNGGGGLDVLSGGAGSDILTGGAGADWFYGGSGADSYFLTDSEKVADRLIFSRDDVSSAAIDKVTGFSSGEDKIDVRGFGFTASVASSGFTSGKGPITFNGDYLKIDTNNDKTADIAIEFVGVDVLVLADFIF